MDSLESMALILFALPAGSLLAVLLLRRVLAWMEDRGYLIISEVTDSNRTLGGSLLSLQELVNPAAKHVIEAREDEDLHEDEDDTGDPAEKARRTLQRRLQEAMGHHRPEKESDR